MAAVAMVVPTVGAALALGAGAATAAPAAPSAYPVTKVTLYYGQSTVAGTLTWYNRSVHLVGTQKVVSGCQKTDGRVFNSAGREVSGSRRTSKPICAGQSAPVELDLPANYPGGAYEVGISIDDPAGGQLGYGALCRNPAYGGTDCTNKL